MTNTKTTRTPRPTRTTVLTRDNLEAARGGTGGTIIVENAVAHPNGVGGTGRTLA